METPQPSFSDPKAVSGYAENASRLVPGLAHMHRMTGLLLAERVPGDGHILVLGAGGGLELKAFADMQPHWRFTGVDPSQEMLAQARATLGLMSSRVELHQGYIDDAPTSPFDGATCLLTLHFLRADERLRTLAEIHRRLKPGAPFVVMHHSFPNTGPEMDRWLARFAAFSMVTGAPATEAERIIAGLKERLPVLSPDEDVAILRAAGFADIELFYAAFTFKGWFAYSS